MSALASAIRNGWNGRLHPKFPLSVALVPLAYDVAWFIAFGRQIPEFTLTLLPLLQFLPYAFIAIGVWSTLALWRCAPNGPPIWPTAWRALGIVLGLYTIATWGRGALFMLVISLGL